MEEEKSNNGQIKIYMNGNIEGESMNTGMNNQMNEYNNKNVNTINQIAYREILEPDNNNG